MSKEYKIHKHIFTLHNLFWYGVISASLIIPTGLYKKILPHPIINEKVIYLFENEKEERYRDRFTLEI